MLTTYLYFKISANPKHRLDKELLSIFAKENKSSLSIIKEIGDFSKAYIATLNSYDKNTNCLRYLKHKIYWTSILSTAVFLKYDHLEELKHSLVAYYYQNWIAGATVARIKQTSFNLLKLIKSNASIEEINAELQVNLKRYATTKTFKEEIYGSYVYGRKWDRAVLLLIEYFSSDGDSTTFIPINNKLHLEHILPQNPIEEWKEVFSDEEIDEWTHSLANLTLLSLRKNVQAKNYSFKEKIEAYKNKDNVVSSFVITQQLFEFDSWGMDELQTRQHALISKIYERLDIF
ncbi:HNH endonuclease [Parashewanella curva]|uniref:HNH endonuclease n=1 Tax=Parashewanella curva TaxID=2338552 RepID=A0A3L8Q0E5_9GAMM|nr:HNH endonuclease family protein [Parashewanella curva]RLV60243.1 HNH endonuclease [Parashewanella curva]